MGHEEETFVVDESRFPLIFVTFPPLPTRRSIDALFDVLDACALKSPFIEVADLTQLRALRVSADVRNYFSERSIRWDEGNGKGRYLGEAIVVTNPFARLIVRGYLWATAGAAYESMVFSDVPTAVAWCERKLDV